MPSFTHRTLKKELLDGEGIPFADIRQNMQELNTINHYLGGHAVTLQGCENLLKNIPLNETITIVEIGCGGGDNLRVIKRWAERNKVSINLVGIDINEECIFFAKQQIANGHIEFICSDYRNVIFERTPHILFTSLFCHHFTDNELTSMLSWLYQNSVIGFFINDLHRHPLAYYSIKLITKAFSKSYLVKNDAPLSVQRSFIKKDWTELLQKSSIKDYSLEWKWAFRWLIVVKK